MAADKKYKFNGMNSKKTVENCQNCHGAPPLEEFELQGMKGNKCGFDGCMIVVNWWKTGTTPVTVKQKITISGTAPGDIDKEITAEYTPGNTPNQLNFNDLKTE